jgi:putative ATPase
VYLANSPKSNASYLAINKAQKIVKETGDLSVPLHLRNAPTKLMKDLDYGKNYKYAHDYQGNFISEEFLPDTIVKTKIYNPGNNARENKFREELKKMWGDKYEY